MPYLSLADFIGIHRSALREYVSNVLGHTVHPGHVELGRWVIENDALANWARMEGVKI